MNTYDLKTSVGKVRFEIPDTDMSKPIFADAEIEYALSVNEDVPGLAAAHCLEVIAGDSRRMLQWSRGNVSSGKISPTDLLMRASRIRQRAQGIVSIPMKRGDWW